MHFLPASPSKKRGAVKRSAIGLPPRNDKTDSIVKLQIQNDKLKNELRSLTVKLEGFVERAKNRQSEKA